MEPRKKRKTTKTTQSPISQQDGIIQRLEALAKTKTREARVEVLAELDDMRQLLPPTTVRWPEGGKLLRPLLEAAEDYIAEPTKERAVEFKTMAEALVITLKGKK
ncbi:hypothetical protein VC83_08591 [Pseudogymnoascus destructans]|uniref:Uncharacterized protein n=1 Tax=Pseudogymnoascus destructans TaxID=655981 RepID=A0A176ZYL0_9PEZI|nr:uncharacterized protein VC83_08591 [Pseudogymnoascus destructans]OAF54968.1 hypothetical protein VC83_08591 [Pseudogymnoascus destructans]